MLEKFLGSWDSNPGRLGVGRERYRCDMPTPHLSFHVVYLSSSTIFWSDGDAAYDEIHLSLGPCWWLQSIGQQLDLDEAHLDEPVPDPGHPN